MHIMVFRGWRCEGGVRNTISDDQRLVLLYWIKDVVEIEVKVGEIMSGDDGRLVVKIIGSGGYGKLTKIIEKSVVLLKHRKG